MQGRGANSSQSLTKDQRSITVVFALSFSLSRSHFTHFGVLSIISTCKCKQANCATSVSFKRSRCTLLTLANPKQRGALHGGTPKNKTRMGHTPPWSRESWFQMCCAMKGTQKMLFGKRQKNAVAVLWDWLRRRENTKIYLRFKSHFGKWSWWRLSSIDWSLTAFVEVWLTNNWRQVCVSQLTMSK